MTDLFTAGAAPDPAGCALDARAATASRPKRSRAEDAARREAVIAFAKPFCTNTLEEIQRRIGKEIDKGALPGPLPDPATIWKWLKPFREEVKARARQQLANQAAGTAVRLDAVQLAEIPPLAPEASPTLCAGQLSALDALLRRHQAALKARNALPPRLSRRMQAESKATGKALDAVRRRRPTWTQPGLQNRIRAMRTAVADAERALRAADLRDADAQQEAAKSPSFDPPLAWSGATVVVPVDPLAPPAKPGSTHLALVRGSAEASLPLYDRGIGPTTWADDFAALAGGMESFGAVIGFADENPTREAAEVRLELLHPVLTGLMTPEAAATAWRAMFVGEALPEGSPILCPPSLEWQAAYSTINGNTIRRWLDKVLRNRELRAVGKSTYTDVEALMHRRKEQFRGPRRVSLDLVKQLRADFTNSPNYSAALLKLELEKRGVTVSERSVQRYIARIEERERGMARGGPAARDVLFRFRLIREAPYPNRAWIMDHSFYKAELIDPQHPDWARGAESGQHDIDLELECVRVTGKYGEKRRRITKLTMTVIMDACTRRILAVRVWDGAPNTATTLLALRDAMERFGTPEVLYTDNGSDLKARAVRDALRLAGIRAVYSMPYCPEGRGKIEKAIQTIKTRILPGIPGFRGKVASPLEDAVLYPIERIQQLVWERVEEHINGKTHSETDRVPAEHYESEIGARGLIGQPAKPSALIPLLTVREEAVVRAEGVYANGVRYAGPGLEGVMIDTRVYIYSDPYRPAYGWVGVRTESGEISCTGRPVRRYGADDLPPDFAEWERLSAEWQSEREAEIQRRRAALASQRAVTTSEDAAVAKGRALGAAVVAEMRQLAAGGPPDVSGDGTSFGGATRASEVASEPPSEVEAEVGAAPRDEALGDPLGDMRHCEGDDPGGGVNALPSAVSPVPPRTIGSDEEVWTSAPSPRLGPDQNSRPELFPGSLGLSGEPVEEADLGPVVHDPRPMESLASRPSVAGVNPGDGEDSMNAASLEEGGAVVPVRGTRRRGTSGPKTAFVLPWARPPRG